MSVAEITTFPHKRMSEAEFEQERKRLHGLYGDSRREAGARYEQALARLYRLCGWAQIEIAKKEGKSQSTVSRMLIFGRFLGFLESENPTESKSINALILSESGGFSFPPGLTERRFYSFWGRTDGQRGGPVNERIRFLEVIRLMKEADEAPPMRPRNKELGKEIASEFADGKWHDVAQVAKKVGASVEDTQTILENIRTHGTFKCKGERKEVKAGHHYRLFPQERTVSTVELVEKLAEPLKRLTEQGKANMATMSPPTVAFWTAKIRELVNEWSGGNQL